jgi:hypothetical protein
LASVKENVLKICYYLEEDKRIIWLDNEREKGEAFLEKILEEYVRYYNIKDLNKKMFIAETDIPTGDFDVIEDGLSGDEVDENALYISAYDNLSERDKRFAGFSPALTITFNWGQKYTAYIFKEK